MTRIMIILFQIVIIRCKENLKEMFYLQLKAVDIVFDIDILVINLQIQRVLTAFHQEWKIHYVT